MKLFKAANRSMLFTLLVIVVMVSLLVMPDASAWAVTAPESDFEFDAATGTITKYIGPGGEVEIPGTIGGIAVTGIGESAFPFNTDVTSIIIPDSVTSIGDKAFYKCYNLKSAYFEGDAPSSFGENVFDYCDYYGDEAITIYYHASASGWTYPWNGYPTCDESLVFDSETGTIKAYHGEGENLYVIIPDTIEGVVVKNIGAQAFDGDWNINSISLPDSLLSIGDRAFSRCWYLTSINIPDSVGSIGQGAFGECHYLTSINIPESVDSLGAAAFYYTGLTSVSIPGSVKVISDSAFMMCSQLSSVNIADGVESIGNNAFYRCGSLSSVTIGDSVSSIGDQAFFQCVMLNSAYFHGNAPTYLGEDVFTGCPGSLIIYYLSTKTGWTNPWNRYDTAYWTPEEHFIFDSETGTIEDYIGPGGYVVIPNTIGEYAVTGIKYYAFSGCSNLSDIIIPDSVTNIGELSFAGCTALGSVSIPGSISRIDDMTFYGCSSLRSAYFEGDAPENFGSQVFDNCADDFIIYYLIGTTGWANPWNSYPTAEIDIKAPGIAELSPDDDGTGISVNDNLLIIFDEEAATGTGNIIIKQASDDSTVETIDVTTEKVSISGATITIDPDVTFAEGTGYYVQIDAGTFTDNAGNNFAGINDTSSWNFTTRYYPAEITVNGSESITIPSSGSITANYTAAVKDRNGNIMEGESVTWSLQGTVTGVSVASASGAVSIDNTAGSGSFILTAEAATADGSVTASLTVNLEAPYLDSVTIKGTIPELTIGYDFNLDSLIVNGFDKYNNFYDINGETVTWNLESGSEYATLSDSILTPEAVGTGSVNAVVAGVSSDEISFIVVEAPYLNTLAITDTIPELIIKEYKKDGYDLSSLTVSGFDQYGNPFDIDSETVTWNLESGSEYATLSSSILIPEAVGTGSVTAAAAGVSSDEVSFTIVNSALVLSTVIIEGTIPNLTVGDEYDLGSLIVSGADQYGNPFDIDSETVSWNLESGSKYAELSGTTLTGISEGSGTVSASIAGIESDKISFTVIVAVLGPSWPADTQLIASDITASSVTLSLSNAASGADSYQIYVNDVCIGDYPSSELIFDISSLNTNTKYTLTVYAADNEGNATEEGISVKIRTSKA